MNATNALAGTEQHERGQNTHSTTATMAEVYDMKKIDGDVHNMHPQTCPAKMMIGMSRAAQ